MLMSTRGLPATYGLANAVSLCQYGIVIIRHPNTLFVAVLAVCTVWLATACSQDWSSGPKDAGQDTGAADSGTEDANLANEADVIVPRAENTPTLGAFATGGEPRRNTPADQAGSLILQNDGFEVGATVCNAPNSCLTGSIAP
jgi:hypothetical protein